MAKRLVRLSEIFPNVTDPKVAIVRTFSLPLPSHFLMTFDLIYIDHGPLLAVLDGLSAIADIIGVEIARCNVD